jgi:glycosyltransferase involved in cell wall biosynthesis
MSAFEPATVTPGDISVVVCAYTLDRWDDLVRAITSVEEQTEPVREVIVVIDHAEELLLRARERFAHRVIPNDRAQGLSGARDTGAAACSGVVVAFLDDDAAVATDWSGAVAQCYTADVLGAGGAVVPVWVAGRPRWWPEEFDWVVGCSYRGQPTGRRRVRNPIGANMSIRRNVWKTIDGFDPRVGRLGAVPTGCEETELFIRAARTFEGAIVVLDTAAVAHHWVPAHRSTWQYFRRRCVAEGTSKRTVAELAGPGAALSTERAYVARTLPSGVLSALLAGEPTRAGAIVAGLVLTTWGYARPRRSSR